MNITTFTIEGPVLTANLPLPYPVDTPVEPYPWDQFLADMQEILAEYGRSAACRMTSKAMMRHVARDGTCYWIRADLDTGPRFLRVYVASHDPKEWEVSLDIALCLQSDVPGRLRLN
ncbi:hypothetical protein [Sphingomonas sp. 3-13AW]|uniref:hypothetical protein n=1 Tax=Sphingomonas sp. 3-13AW TaxID=3050450 RepID=UPI003BB6BC99